MTDFEFRVWDQYQLSADDFGVMRCSAIIVQAANDSLADRPTPDVQAALQRLVSVGLNVVFEHQGYSYICQLDWQTFQKVEYPRRTILPKPPDEILAQCDSPTQRLFKKHPGGENKRRRKRRGTDPESPPEHVPDTSPSVSQGVTAPRETAHTNGLRQTANGKRVPGIRGSSALAGSLPRDHVRHAFCGRKCVPEFLHGEFLQAFGGDQGKAARQLQTWYESVDALLPDTPIGDPPVDFWRAKFAEAFPSAVKKPSASVRSFDTQKSNVPDATRTEKYLKSLREPS